MRLRDYQQECLRKIDKEKARGIQKMLTVLPTGTGKTIIFVQRAKETAGKTLILVHRDELLRQAQDKLLTIWPEAETGIVKAARNELDAQVTIASVQTLSRRKRLEQVDGHKFELIVTDEAHHAVAPTYRRIYDAIWDNTPEQIHLGVTATADRSDRKNLGKVFQKIVYHRDLLGMIKLGWLCNLRCLQVQTNISLGGVRIRRGDFVSKELSSVVNTSNRNELIVKAFEEHATNRLSLCFTVDIQHAHDLADAFQKKGVNAVALSGETPINERHSILKRFHEGEIRMVCNCMVLTEGFDEPAIDCIVMARPTKSGLLFQQMIGRGTRTFPGKEDCLILDVADNAGRHSIMNIPRIFNVSEKDMDEEKTITEIVNYAASQDEARLRAPGEGLETKEVNLFATSELVWVKVTPQKFLLGLGDLGTIQVFASKTVGKYVARLVPRGSTEQLDWITPRPVDLSWALGLAESVAMEIAGDRKVLYTKDAKWRHYPPTGDQLRELRRYGVEAPPGATRGDVGNTLSALFAGASKKDFKAEVREMEQAKVAEQGQTRIAKQLSLWQMMGGEKK